MNEEKEDDYFVRLHELLEATNKQDVMSNPNPATPTRNQVKELQIIYRTKKGICLHVSTVAKEANTKESFICATAGRQNLHHATQQVVLKELEELEIFPT